MLYVSKHKLSGIARVAFGLSWCLLLPGASLTISANRLVPGARAQIRLALDRPLAVATGGFTLTLPAEVFGPVADVQVFSAAGDALGTAKIDGHRVEVSFSSVSGGIGRVDGLPVATITAPVLATATAGAIPAPLRPFAIELKAFKDRTGTVLPLYVRDSPLAVGGSLAMESVVPVAEDRYRIAGRGFTAQTRLTAPGLPLALITFESPTAMEFTLAGAAELTGQLLQMQNADGESTDLVYALETTLAADSYAFRVFTPLRGQSTIDLGRSGTVLVGSNGIALENPHPVAVDVALEALQYAGPMGIRETFKLPPRSRLAKAIETVGVPYKGTGGITASLPIRAASIWIPGNYSSIDPEIKISETKPFEPFRLPAQAFGAPLTPLHFLYRLGGVLPSPQSVGVATWIFFLPFDPITVTSDAPWLVVTPSGNSFTIKAVPGSLPPGEYNGTVTAAVKTPGNIPQTFPVRFTILGPSSIGLPPTYPRYSTANGPVQEDSLQFWGEMEPPVAVTVRVETEGGRNWLSVLNPPATTAMPVNFRIDPAGLPIGVYRGRIIARGPANEQTAVIELNVQNPEKGLVRTEPAEVAFFVEAGPANAPKQVVVAITGGGPLTLASPSTHTGGNWLSVITDSANAFRIVADARALSPGDYAGTVQVTTRDGREPAMIPVRVHVSPPGFSGITTWPSPLVLTGLVPMDWQSVAPIVTAGVSATIVISRTGDPVSAQISVVRQPDGCNLSAGLSPLTRTPVRAVLNCTGPPGKYEGAIRVSAGSDSVELPVSITIPPLEYTSSVSRPTITAVTHGASNVSGPVVAGAAITLHGLGRDRQVTFDGLPATVFYESLFQANVLVPEGIAGRASTTIRVRAGETTTATLAVAALAPGIFTLDGSGRGQGAVLNQDNAINGVERPAAPGSIVQIFATGAMVADRVRVTMGGVESSVLFAGPVALGLFQVNAVVPAVSGTVPLTLEVGGVPAQRGVSVEVK